MNDEKIDPKSFKYYLKTSIDKYQEEKNDIQEKNAMTLAKGGKVSTEMNNRYVVAHNVLMVLHEINRRYNEYHNSKEWL